MLFKAIFSILIFSFSSFFTIGIAQQPKLMLPTGHGIRIKDMAISHDGKYMASASDDRTAILWETKTGRQIHTLVGHTDAVTRVWFTADDKNIISVSFGESAVYIWDKESGKLLNKIKCSSVSECKPGKNNSVVFITGSDGILSCYNLPNAALLYKVPAHDGIIQSMDLSVDDKQLVTAGDDHKLKIWNTENGTLLRNFDMAVYNTYMLLYARFSPDTKKILVCSLDTITVNDERNDTGFVRILDAVTGKKLEKFTGHDGRFEMEYSADQDNLIRDNLSGLVQLISTTGNKIIIDATVNYGYRYKAFLQSNNGKMLFTSLDNEISCWNTTTGKILYKIRMPFKNIGSIKISGNDAFLMAGSEDDGMAILMDAGTGKEISRFSGQSFISYYPKFSPDGNSIFNASTDFNIRQWNKSTGRLERVYGGQQSFIVFYQLLKKDNRMLTIGLDSSIIVWDINSGNLLFSLKLPGINEGDQFSLDELGTKLVSKRSQNQNYLRVWDIKNGTNHTDILLPNSNISDIKISPDGKRLAVASYDTVIYILDATTGETLFSSREPGVEGAEICFSPDNSKLLLFCWNSTKIMDVTSGKIIGETLVNNESLRPGKFNHDGKYFYTQSVDNDFHIWRTKDITKVSNIKLKEGASINTYFDKQDRLITQSTDNKTRIWDINKGTELHSFDGPMGCDIDNSGDTIVTALNNEWLLYTVNDEKLIYKSLILGNENLVFDNKGRYDGSEAARKLIYFTCGTELIELDQVKDQLWVPNLAERKIKADSINAKTLNELNICGLMPLIEEQKSDGSEYIFKITARTGGLGETVLFVNGIEARRYQPAQLYKNGAAYDLIIKKAELNNFFIAGKENPVTLKSYTADNTISSRGIIVLENKTKQAATPPNLYAVMVGVSDYKGDELDLKYAAKDATDISSVVSNAAKKLLNTDGKEHVFMYNLTTAKERYQLPEKNSIKKVLEEIGKKATANDILMIFFAGHGVMSDRADTGREGLPAGQAGDKKQFYFLTADASNSSATTAVSDVGISTAELTDWMKPQNIKAQKRILIFDACNSGQAIKDFVKMGNEDQNYLAARNDDKSQQIKALDKLNEKSGLFILSASASNQSAYEMGRYSQGLLTYALLKAIKQQPDILEEGKYLNVSRWFNAAEKTVSDLSKENGARQEPQIVSNTNFNIGMVDDNVMARIILPTEKPLFAASNFQNSDEAADGDNLELSKFINLQLNEVALRGSDSKIVYVTASNSPEAYTLSGRYDVNENTVSIRISIKKNNETKHRFEEKGTKETLKELANRIVTKSAEWSAGNK